MIEDTRSPAKGVILTKENIEQYLSQMEQCCLPDTVRSYRKTLCQFYESLTEDKIIDSSSLPRFVETIKEQRYSTTTVSKYIAIVNGMLDHIGRRDLQFTQYYQKDTGPAPQITREEYLRLLSTARGLDDRRGYLLVKLLASVDLPTNGLSHVTLEAVNNGLLMFFEKDKTRLIRLPQTLRKELLDFAREQDIISGPLFVSRSGGPMRRENLHSILQRLCQAAHVDTGKGNISCLKRLYRTTQDELKAQINVENIVAQMQERLFEREETQIGWH